MNNAVATPQPMSSDKSQNLQQSSTPQPSQGLRVPSNRKTIYDRHLNRSRNAELSRASFAYLFAEMVTYAQRRVTGIQDLEKRCVTDPWLEQRGSDDKKQEPKLLILYFFQFE